MLHFKLLTKYLCAIIATFFILNSCKKVEGKGGKLSIKGSVLTRFYNKDTYKFTQQKVGSDVEVYIIYGDQVGYGDRTRTDINGNFEFKYLQAGDYTIYTYSKDSTGVSPDEQVSVSQKVSLSSSTTIPTLTIAQFDKSRNDIYSISGKVFANFYKNEFTVKTRSSYITAENVFLLKDGDPNFLEKEDTRIGGEFVFTELSPGTYTIYAISKDTTLNSGIDEIIVSKKITITNSNQQTPDLVIAKEDKTKSTLQITGQIFANYYNSNFSKITQSGFKAGESVYLTNSSSIGYLDKTTTDINGNFSFMEVEPGTYTIYTYSEDSTRLSASGELIVTKQASVSNTSVNIGKITIAKKDESQKNGAYSVSGVVTVYFCNSSFTRCSGPFPTPDINVFIVREGENMYFDDVSTGLNGEYQINDLPAGNYTVYAVSKNQMSVIDPTQPEIIAIEKKITITDANITNIDIEIVD